MTKQLYAKKSIWPCQLNFKRLANCYWILVTYFMDFHRVRTSRPEKFLRKDSKFTEHSCRSGISIKLLCNFIEIALRHGCSPVNLLYISRTPFPRNTSGWLLLQGEWSSSESLGQYEITISPQKKSFLLKIFLIKCEQIQSFLR